MAQVIRQLLESPLVLIDVVAQANLGVDIVSKEVDVSLALRASVETWELEERLLDTSVVVDVNSIFEHVVNEVGRRLDEVIEGRKHLHVLSLLLVEDIEFVLVLVELHAVDGLLEFGPLVLDHLLALLDLLLLFLQLLYFLVYLLLHHLE